jgi:hypothetical protein
VVDYVTGFSTINNRERFRRDAREGEAQFDRTARPSKTAATKRIAYLYPDGTPAGTSGCPGPKARVAPLRCTYSLRVAPATRWSSTLQVLCETS